MSTSRKRKRRYSESHKLTTQNAFSSTKRDLSPDPALFIQAYEADIIRGPNAALAAISVEVSTQLSSSSKSSPIKVGDALIKWEGHQLHGAQPAFPGDDDDFGGRGTADENDNDAIWVDRYDARLLLDTLPPINSPAFTQNAPKSPGGWSDLPSDDEDIFFFSPEEADDFRREKKRRHIDRIRDERLKARRAEDGASSEEQEEEEVWGGSDEEPDEAEKDLMQRTASHLLESPNPAQLEMRILANHGRDKRFAFLRGRWSRTWKILKGKAKLEKESQEKANAGNGGGLGTLADYGDSDDDSDGSKSAAAVVEDQVQPEVKPGGPVSLTHDPADTAAMEARRARARVWVEKRRSGKDTSS
ncbi:hypothetical protein Hypma_010938 [Hypsizygus marmoreus]|uniref:Uncharacterized protein n=1 Tax=Hypsizygus marmoreus TaxID=39966 RepID=A0A369JT90_HYPMA|nr:hypothetical protein Hypma_010938 [Hypsizygus marmoreus]